MNPTNIEYLTHTWNPIAMRCTPIGEGCKHCWHLAMAKRLANNPCLSSGQRNAYAGGLPMLLEERLNDPLKRKKPARIGVQFMGDLFYKDISFPFLFNIWGVMAKARWHTFLILTKRPENMQERLSWMRYYGELPNLYLGISAENQQTLDERIPILLQIPAAKRFVSLEPMLGPVDLCEDLSYPPFLGPISWVIIGGLSLPGGKVQVPDPQWIDDIVEQCDQAGVPLFIKENAGYYRHREEFPG